MKPLEGFDFAALRTLLAELRADAWLLYDFRGINPAATRVLGIHGMGTRRFFVLLPREGKPVALAHRIELAAFDGFPGEVRPYAAWPELHEQLRALVGGKTVAMEISPRDAVPYLDRVPHGVVELIEASGAHVVSSGVLVSRFAARWSPAELAGHRRAAEAIAEIAVATLPWAGSELARGAAAGEVMLLDLWAGVSLGSVFADQTWMAFAGREPNQDVRRAWCVVRDARVAAVELLRDRWQKKQPVTGAAVDDAVRGVIRTAGFGEYFVHRTGHSIDRDLHGSGPHIDNFETADERTLIP